MTAHRSSGRRSSVAIHYIGLTRRIVSAERTGAADTQLGLVLTFVAGATNAGGFLAIGQYTSHMSGIFSAMADHLALGAVGLVLVGLGALLAFMAGAACSAMLINWGRRSGRGSCLLSLRGEAIGIRRPTYPDRDQGQACAALSATGIIAFAGIGPASGEAEINRPFTAQLPQRLCVGAVPAVSQGHLSEVEIPSATGNDRTFRAGHAHVAHQRGLLEPDPFGVEGEGPHQPRQLRTSLGAPRHEAGHHVLRNPDIAGQCLPLVRFEGIEFVRPYPVQSPLPDRRCQTHGRLHAAGRVCPRPQVPTLLQRKQTTFLPAQAATRGPVNTFQ
jgi:hypothetical protein